MDRSPDLESIYEWVLSAQQDLAELETAFPQSLKNERQRVLLSIRMLRVSVEIRIQHSFPKRAGGIVTATDPHDPTLRLNLFDQGGPD